MVRVGKTYQQIIQLALEAQIDLVVMGVRGRGALDTALFGSTTLPSSAAGTLSRACSSYLTSVASVPPEQPRV
jgi:Universal stress protein family